MGPNNLIEKIKDKFKKDFQNSIEEEDFEDIIDAVHKNGIIESEEKEMINNVLDFSEMCVKDVMTPYANICFLNIDSTYKEILELYQKEMYTIIPLYKENNDNIIGILNIKDLILYDKKKRFKIEDFLREPYYTYELKNTKELMKEMREKSIAMSIVLDEYGATTGLVTLEDLIEEIVGEIKDEYDEDEEKKVEKIDEQKYIIDGSIKLNELKDLIDIDIKSDECDSVGGVIIESLGHIPEEKENVIIDSNIELTVEKIDKNRIEKIQIHILDS